MRLRFTIGRLIAVIVACGAGFAALRSGSDLWASVLYSTVLVAMALGLIHAGCGRGRVRVFWAGFTLVLGLYFAAAFGPWGRENVGPRPVTTALIQTFYARITPAEAPKNLAGGVVWLPNGEQGATQRFTTGSQVSLSNVSGQPGVVQGTFAFTGLPATPEAPGSFRAIGHSLWALLLAVLGGAWARRRYDLARLAPAETSVP